MTHIKGGTMKKIDKYLQQVRLYRLKQQINRTTFEMALYFDYFGIDDNKIVDVFNTTLDYEQFTDIEKNRILEEAKKKLNVEL